ncbi:MAG: serine protease [Methylococcaceae bacterium]
MKTPQYLLSLILIMGSVANLNAQAQTTTAVHTPRIVGGKISTAGKWPWMMALVSKGYNNYNGQFCGGSLISPTWVITAAHCVEYKSTSTFNVVANLLDLKSDKGQVITLKRIIRHPSYNPYTLDNDIALLQLSKPVTNAKVLPLITGNPLLVNVKATIIGWGALSETDSSNGIYPRLLYEAVLPTVSNNVCINSYGASAITNNMLCAGLAAGGKDTCQGDSGGPLMIQQNGQWQLAGITSNGEGCAEPNYYGIYTRVSRYITFINNTMKKYGN